MPISEAQTRVLQIDPQLRAADWKLNDRTQVRLEVPVDGYDAEPWNGVTDYCLYDASGNVLAVVEAKRCSRNAREADEQLRYYINEIAKRQTFPPFDIPNRRIKLAKDLRCYYFPRNPCSERDFPRRGSRRVPEG